MPGMDIPSRLQALNQSLADFKPNEYVAWTLAVVYNTLLEAVKQEHPDDPVIAVLEPATRAVIIADVEGPDSTVQVGTMRGEIAQVLAAIG
jgi:hypothetical protein